MKPDVVNETGLECTDDRLSLSLQEKGDGDHKMDVMELSAHELELAQICGGAWESTMLTVKPRPQCLKTHRISSSTWATVPKDLMPVFA